MIPSVSFPNRPKAAVEVSINVPGILEPSGTSDRPARILLDQEAYIAAGHRNATTAATISLDGRAFEPRVVGAEGPFVLLRVRFAAGDIEDDDEYFMYKADAKSPSLEPVPPPEDDLMPRVNETPGIFSWSRSAICVRRRTTTYEYTRLRMEHGGRRDIPTRVLRPPLLYPTR
ncbi:hypothetical protein PR202_ga26887 [Eleusine coracana subsp. coracana]|uniref:Uncharacterized protein n=1 Tax=Eleusine coracana subsp. coracana TaxID=191504 RepID=A0AAV5DEV9_ELECO|nr:hypothetical protein PR202_ga26887 [Eleusine coracana subsp. coracana]